MQKGRLVRLVAVLVASVLVSAPASATLTFTFSDAGGGTTLVTGSGSVDLTGRTAATSPHSEFVGWDDFGAAGNGSTALVADSDFFSFNSPNVGGVFSSYASVLGATPLNVGGVNLRTMGSGDGLWLDGTAATFPFFVLGFENTLAQTGVAAAGGSAVLSFAFANLPYAAGQSIDLQGNGDVVFEFVPEPSLPLLAACAVAALAAMGRRRTP